MAGMEEVVIGNGIAGFSAASNIRRLNGKCDLCGADPECVKNTAFMTL